MAGQIKNFDQAEIAVDLKWLEREDYHLMCWHDGDYSALLKEIPDPPPVLFIRGDWSLLSQQKPIADGVTNNAGVC